MELPSPVRSSIVYTPLLTCIATKLGSPTSEDKLLSKSSTTLIRAGRFKAARLIKIKCRAMEPSALPSSSPYTTSTGLALREIPGSYGLPFFGPLKDRLDFFWFQGEDKFFEERMKRYKSSVFRVNFVPVPPGFPDSRGIALLDQNSYGVLYDSTKVEKEEMFTGSYVPSLKFTGGYRVLPRLDPSHEKHTVLKNLLFELLKVNSIRIFPEFSTAFSQTFDSIEKEIAQGKQVDFYTATQKFILDFLIRTFVHRDPSKPGHASLGNNGPSIFQTWIGVQYCGIAQAGLPHIIEELALHSFPLPFILAKSSYDKIYKFFETYATEALDIATSKFDLDREEATHNLIFIVGVNAWLGLIRLFPAILYHVGKQGGNDLQARLRAEVRTAMSSSPSGLTLESIASMPLVKSTVLEVLRLSAPAKYQYARAKTDLILESHDAAFLIKKGELLGGALHFASRDPAVFENPEAFVADRFMGDEGRKLLPHLLWSNGYHHQPSTAQNKQCGGKDYVELVSCLLLAELFARYDSFHVADPATIYSNPPKAHGSNPTADVDFRYPALLNKGFCSPT